MVIPLHTSGQELSLLIFFPHEIILRIELTLFGILISPMKGARGMDVGPSEGDQDLKRNMTKKRVRGEASSDF